MEQGRKDKEKDEGKRKETEVGKTHGFFFFSWLARQHEIN